MREYLLALIQDIETSGSYVPAKYIVELAEYPNAAAKLLDVDWTEGAIRVKADILAVARDVLETLV